MDGWMDRFIDGLLHGTIVLIAFNVFLNQIKLLEPRLLENNKHMSYSLDSQYPPW